MKAVVRTQIREQPFHTTVVDSEGALEPCGWGILRVCHDADAPLFI